MKILPLLLISLVLCNVSIKNQNSAISVFKCLLTDEKFIGSLKNIISSLREHLEDKDVLALIKSLLENVPVALKEINVCLNSEPVLQSWWNDFVDKVNDIIEDATDSISDFFNDIKHNFDNIGKDLQNRLEQIGMEISENFQKLKYKVLDITDDVKNKIKNDKKKVEELANDVKTKMDDIKDNAKDKIEDVVSDVKYGIDIIQQAWDLLPQEKKDEIIKFLIENVLEIGEEGAISACCAATAETLVGCPICYVAITFAVDEIEKLSEEYAHA
jgi:gas vesicle protein